MPKYTAYIRTTILETYEVEADDIEDLTVEYVEREGLNLATNQIGKTVVLATRA